MAEKVVNHKGEESSGTRVWCVETTRLRRERGERERGGKGAFYFEDVVKETTIFEKACRRGVHSTVVVYLL